MKNLMLIMLPISTGLAAALWAKIIGNGQGLYTICIVQIFEQITVFWLLRYIQPSAPLFIFSWWLIPYFVISVITILLWRYPMTIGISYSSMALMEGGWPLVSILAASLLIGNQNLTMYHYIGGAMIIGGSTLIGLHQH